MKTISKICLHCDNEFQGSLKEHRRGNAKFCSQLCACSYRTANVKPQEPNCECAQCSKPIYKSPSKMKAAKSGLMFCSRTCKEKAQMIGGMKEIQPDHYGKAKGRWTYRDKAFETHPKKCIRCGYDEHPEILEVHHKDRNRSNNSSENFEVLCPNCHMWEHYINKDGRYTRSKALVEAVGIEPS